MTKGPANPERRAHQRRDIRIPVGIGIQSGEESCETVNISRTGICCRMDHPIPLFTKVQVSLVFPNGETGTHTVECEGIVVRQEQTLDSEERPFETAIFFQDIDERTAALLDDRLRDVRR